MPIFYRDPRSDYRLHFPSQADQNGVMALAETFLAYEKTRPPEQQTPYTAAIDSWYQELRRTHEEKLESKSRHSISSQRIKQLDAEATQLIRQMWKTVTLHCYDVLSEATRWGFTMKQTTGNVLMPHDRDERLALLTAYIHQEENRPAAERFQKPPLAEIIAVRDGLKENLTAFQTTDTQEDNSLEACRALTKKLSDYLRAAGVYILAGEFEMKLSAQLHNWGYDVAIKRRKSNGQDDATPVDEPAPEFSTNGSTPTNGSTEIAMAMNGQGMAESDE